MLTEAPTSLKLRPRISQYVIGANAPAAITPETTRPCSSARSTLPDFERTAYVPMIDAMIATPPITSG